MCGLVGVAGTITSKEERAFRTLLRLDVLRGEDSTGIASMSSKGKFTIAKDAENAYTFLNTKEARKPFEGWLKILMGHNRAATKGAVVAENAHPFEYGNIIGAHNGTLSYWGNLLDGGKFKVDSQAVFYHMSEESVEDLWKNLNGAAALVWMNKKDKTINFLRNDKRELAFTTTTDGKTFFWASEPWMLMVACAREGIDIEKPVMFTTNVHYELHVADGKLDMKVRELEPYKYVYKPIVTTSSTARRSESVTPISSEKYNAIHKGEIIKFEIDILRDFTTAEGARKCNVFGVSDDGLAVRIWGVEADRFEWLLDIMAREELFFEGKILNKSTYHVEVDIKTVFPLFEEIGAVEHGDNKECKCEVCGDKVEEGKGHVQQSGKVFCDECQLDLIALNNEGYV